jgi:hypothetical protein
MDQNQFGPTEAAFRLFYQERKNKNIESYLERSIKGAIALLQEIPQKNARPLEPVFSDNILGRKPILVRPIRKPF